MKLEWRDFVIIFLGFLAIGVGIERLIIYRGILNNIMSGFMFLIGLYLFSMVYRKIKSKKVKN